MAKITNETTVEDARQFITDADAAAARRMEREGIWDEARGGWVRYDAAGEREGVHCTGTRPHGSGRDYRRAHEIVRRAAQ